MSYCDVQGYNTSPCDNNINGNPLNLKWGMFIKNKLSVSIKITSPQIVKSITI